MVESQAPIVATSASFASLCPLYLAYEIEGFLSFCLSLCDDRSFVVVIVFALLFPITLFRAFLAISGPVWIMLFPSAICAYGTRRKSNPSCCFRLSPSFHVGVVADAISCPSFPFPVPMTFEASSTLSIELIREILRFFARPANFLHVSCIYHVTHGIKQKLNSQFRAVRCSSEGLPSSSASPFNPFGVGRVGTNPSLSTLPLRNFGWGTRLRAESPLAKAQRHVSESVSEWYRWCRSGTSSVPQ